jgi:hypothetical protein
MKTKEAFGVAVRVVGLIVAFLGAFFLVSGLGLLLARNFLPGTLDLLVGFLLIRGVRHVIPARIFR